MGDYSIFSDKLNKWNIGISEVQIEQFNDYFNLLSEWNQKINLTSICEFGDVIHKHFLDSLSIMKFSDISDSRIIDIGTGGGFPGIPLAIMNPSASFMLLDSLNKRINFLNLVIDELNLINVKTVHARAEDLAFDKKYREQFDIAASRAVSNLSTLSEYCLPFVKKGGFFISFKSEHCETEVNESEYAVSVLGGSVHEVFEYDLDYMNIKNKLIYINKIKNTNHKYPRKAGVPSKLPLCKE